MNSTKKRQFFGHQNIINKFYDNAHIIKAQKFEYELCFRCDLYQENKKNLKSEKN